MDERKALLPRGAALEWTDADDQALATDATKATNERPGFVYFIGAPGLTGRMKIGWARVAESRLAALQTGSSEPLMIYGRFEGSRGDESRMHSEFRHLRRQGEWFDLDHDLMLLVIGLGANFDLSHDDGTECGKKCNQAIIARFGWALVRRYDRAAAARRVIRRLRSPRA